jgi:hypothetical protein
MKSLTQEDAFRFALGKCIEQNSWGSSSDLRNIADHLRWVHHVSRYLVGYLEQEMERRANETKKK